MNILIVGYAYIKRGYLDTFNKYPDRNNLYFLMPKVWKAKNGKLLFRSPEDKNIYKTPFLFHHSEYPLIGGLLKGWAPLFPAFLFKKRFGIVYSCSEPILLTTLYNAIFAKLFGAKHIIFTWENISYKDKFSGLNLFLKKLILKLNLLLSDGIICGNKKARDIFKGFTDKLIEVIPMSGVDVDFYHRKESPKKIGSLDLTGKLVFNFSGAVGYRKGIHLILKSFKIVLAQLPNSHLLIIGNGEDDVKINNLIKELGVESAVSRIGWLNKEGLREAFNSSDVFVYPSLAHGGWEEQFGYSMAEASLMELPVISTKTGSIEEVVIDSETGILVEPDNEEQLIQAMLKLGTNDVLRLKLGKSGNKYISSNFSYSIVADKFYNFFKRV